MSQKSQVLRHLRRSPITPIQALDKYGCFRLADVVFKLRGDGHAIITETVRKGDKRFARYKLVS